MLRFGNQFPPQANNFRQVKLAENRLRILPEPLGPRIKSASYIDDNRVVMPIDEPADRPIEILSPHHAAHLAQWRSVETAVIVPDTLHEAFSLTITQDRCIAATALLGPHVKRDQ